jgi:hypothetical protein
MSCLVKEAYFIVPLQNYACSLVGHPLWYLPHNIMHPCYREFFVLQHRKHDETMSGYQKHYVFFPND